MHTRPGWDPFSLSLHTATCVPAEDAHRLICGERAKCESGTIPLLEHGVEIAGDQRPSEKSGDHWRERIVDCRPTKRYACAKNESLIRVDGQPENQQLVVVIPESRIFTFHSCLMHCAWKGEGKKKGKHWTKEVRGDGLPDSTAVPEMRLMMITQSDACVCMCVCVQ